MPTYYNYALNKNLEIDIDSTILFIVQEKEGYRLLGSELSIEALKVAYLGGVDEYWILDTEIIATNLSQNSVLFPNGYLTQALLSREEVISNLDFDPLNEDLLEEYETEDSIGDPFIEGQAHSDSEDEYYVDTLSEYDAKKQKLIDYGVPVETFTKIETYLNEGRFLIFALRNITLCLTALKNKTWEDKFYPINKMREWYENPSKQKLAELEQMKPAMRYHLKSFENSLCELLNKLIELISQQALDECLERRGLEEQELEFAGPKMP